MPLDLQTRLLRVLAEGEVMPLGGDAPVRVDIDMICATHRDLAQMIAAGTFREDLYYRLSGASLPMPPLRERADIRDLIDAVFDEEAQMAGHVLTLDPQLAERLVGFAWPGNIRQLRNVLRYACAICDGARVELRHVAPDIAALLAPEAAHKPAFCGSIRATAGNGTRGRTRVKNAHALSTRSHAINGGRTQRRKR